MSMRQIKASELFPIPMNNTINSKNAFHGLINETSQVNISKKVISRWEKTRPGESMWGFGAGQIKLNGDKPSPALTRVGDASYSMFHYLYPRPLLVTEMKRLQSFSDHFELLGTYKEKKDRIGNSVPPLFMVAIANSIREKMFDGNNNGKTEPRRKKYVDILNDAWQDHLRPREQDAPTVISTFAGCGGSSLGYSMAGYRELLAVEWDDNAVETFRLNFPGVPVYHGDIAKLSVEECMRLANIKEGELDILDGSPPCQGFSTAGKRRFSDIRNQLFKEYVRLLRGLRPKVFVMENVSGMVKGVMKLIFAEIMRELKASGYDVSARMMNAMYFNVPQSRERIIFIGIRKDLAWA